MAAVSTAISTPVGRSLWLDRRFFLGFALVLHLACAYASSGWYALDEHFQTVEFARYKLGQNTPADLSWEFHHRMRPALQPGIAYAVMQAGDAVGVRDPFVLAGLLRTASGLLGLLCQFLLWITLAPQLKSDQARKWFAVLSCVLWFLPYQHVRFSSESWSGSLFWAGAALLWSTGSRRNADSGSARSWWAGLLLGLSMVARMQTGLLVLPLLTHRFLLQRADKRSLWPSFAGIALASGVGLLLDRWFYGAWALTDWNYFNVNILQGKAAGFGTEPWWYYPVMVAQRGVYPIGLAILAAAVVFAVKRPRHVVTWLLVPFLLVHTFLAHKELRFLFPLVSIVPFVLVAAAESISSGTSTTTNNWIRRACRVGLFAFLTLNILVLCVATLKPADPVTSLYRFLYDRTRTSPAVLFYDTENPYQRASFSSELYPEGSPLATPRGVAPREVVLEANFYKPSGLTVEPWPGTEALTGTLPFLYATRKSEALPQLPGVEFKRVYSYVPDWLRSLDFTGWVERTQTWSVYEGRMLTPR